MRRESKQRRVIAIRNTRIKLMKRNGNCLQLFAAFRPHSISCECIVAVAEWHASVDRKENAIYRANVQINKNKNPSNQFVVQNGCNT